MQIINWIIALLKGYLGIEADIKQKQAEHVGEVIQQNADLTDALKEAKNDEKILSAPARADSAIDADLLRHADK